MKKWLLVLICCVLTFSHADAVSGPRRVLLFGKAKAIVVGNLPLDGISAGVKACYSTRQLLTAYGGKSMNVTRASDSTSTDIGFVANVFDTSSLNTFCSGTTCLVNKWYDQCGGGFDLSQSASGPAIYTGGAVTVINSKPAPQFNGVTPNGLTNASLSANPVNTLYQNVVIRETTSGNGGFSGGSATGTLEFRSNVTTNTLALNKASLANILTSSNTITLNTGAIAEAQYNATSGAGQIWINSSSGGTATNAQTLSAGQFILGRHAVGDNYTGQIGEYIAYDLVGGIPGASQTAIENNQRAYWGTP